MTVIMEKLIAGNLISSGAKEKCLDKRASSSRMYRGATNLTNFNRFLPHVNRRPPVFLLSARAARAYGCAPQGGRRGPQGKQEQSKKSPKRSKNSSIGQGIVGAALLRSAGRREKRDTNEHKN